ncbi:MAG: SRPBCC family protein [Chlorobi bacterium]|nr:SRPBCC family protein [Chlorobiota bacterium]
MFNLGELSELKIESKIGQLHKTSEEVYSFLSDFNNFSNLIPADKIKDWQATEDSCSFKVEKAGKIGLQIIEKDPPSLIKISGTEEVPYKFNFWIQLKELNEADTRIKITVNAKLNPIIRAAAKNPLQKFIDSAVDKLEEAFS